MAYKGFKGIGPRGYGCSPIKFVPPPSGVEATGNVPPTGYGPAPGEALMSDQEVRSDQIDTKYGMQDVIPSGMTTGADNHLDEVVLTAGPREQTRVEHRLDKTQAKGEAAAEAGNYAKANRLQARKQRLMKRAERQEGRDKKKYARKDKKFWRRQQEQDKVQ
jgi:hypothetical protein